MADEPHNTFVVTITCVECGWEWSGYSDEAQKALEHHTETTTHAG